jgi:hypothetical protein
MAFVSTKTSNNSISNSLHPKNIWPIQVYALCNENGIPIESWEENSENSKIRLLTLPNDSFRFGINHGDKSESLKNLKEKIYESSNDGSEHYFKFNQEKINNNSKISFQAKHPTSNASDGKVSTYHPVPLMVRSCSKEDYETLRTVFIIPKCIVTRIGKLDNFSNPIYKYGNSWNQSFNKTDIKSYFHNGDYITQNEYNHFVSPPDINSNTAYPQLQNADGSTVPKNRNIQSSKKSETPVVAHMDLNSEDNKSIADFQKIIKQHTEVMKQDCKNLLPILQQSLKRIEAERKELMKQLLINEHNEKMLKQKIEFEEKMKKLTMFD